MKTFKMPEPILTTTKEMSDIIPSGTKLYTETAFKQALHDLLTEAKNVVTENSYHTRGPIRSILEANAKEIDALREQLPK